MERLINFIRLIIPQGLKLFIEVVLIFRRLCQPISEVAQIFNLAFFAILIVSETTHVVIISLMS